jgi:hypothetical protein
VLFTQEGDPFAWEHDVVSHGDGCKLLRRHDTNEFNQNILASNVATKIFYITLLSWGMMLIYTNKSVAKTNSGLWIITYAS